MSKEDAWKEPSVTGWRWWIRSVSETVGLRKQRTHLEKPRRRSSKNLVHLPPIAFKLARGRHQRARVDCAGGDHQRPSQQNVLLDDATSGTSKSKLAETKMKELQARNEEDRTQQIEIESWQTHEGKASLG